MVPLLISVKKLVRPNAYWAAKLCFKNAAAAQYKMLSQFFHARDISNGRIALRDSASAMRSVLYRIPRSLSRLRKKSAFGAE